MDRAGLSEHLDVSRETIERLELYAALLKKWSARINLVSPATLEDLWTRHFLDSAQIHALAGDARGDWADLGSGAGFPGMVVAILDAEVRQFDRFTLLESDQRKAAFLRTVARETGVAADIVTARIESAPPLGADVISARALADLPRLLAFAERHAAPHGICLFHKGQSWENEVAAARAAWSFGLEVSTSMSDPRGVVLRIGEIARA